MKKTKDIISQENKFLRLCGDNYRDKIKKKIPMTVGDFKKFMYLFDAMGLSKYSIYFSMEMFPELLVEYGERSKDCDWDIGYGEYDFPVEEIPVFAAITIKRMWKSSRNLALEGLRFIK